MNQNKWSKLGSLIWPPILQNERRIRKVKPTKLWKNKTSSPELHFATGIAQIGSTVKENGPFENHIKWCKYMFFWYGMLVDPVTTVSPQPCYTKKNMYLQHFVWFSNGPFSFTIEPIWLIPVAKSSPWSEVLFFCKFCLFLLTFRYKWPGKMTHGFGSFFFKETIENPLWK